MIGPRTDRATTPLANVYTVGVSNVEAWWTRVYYVRVPDHIGQRPTFVDRDGAPPFRSSVSIIDGLSAREYPAAKQGRRSDIKWPAGCRLTRWIGTRSASTRERHAPL